MLFIPNDAVFGTIEKLASLFNLYLVLKGGFPF